MKLVVLDCDGTLVDSQNGICEAMTHAFTGFGLVAPTREATLAIVGLSLPEAFAVLAAEHDEALRAQMVQRYKSRLPARSAAIPSCTSRCSAASPRPSRPSASAMTSCSASPPASRARASTGCSSARAGRTASSPCRRPTIIRQSPIPPCCTRPWRRRARRRIARSWSATPPSTWRWRARPASARWASPGAITRSTSCATAGAHAVIESCDSLTADIDAFFAAGSKAA